MEGYLAFAYRWLGRFGERMATRDADLQKRLAKAHLLYRAGAYLAGVYLAAAGAVAFGLAFGGLVALVATALPLALRLLFPLVAATLLASIILLGAPLWLQNTATERAKDIDENLPHGLNYMLALANGGLPPKDMWRSLARAEVFGALAAEAGRIHRDLDLFGQDLLTAMRHAQERTPSKRFHEFLQGAISSFQSGVELESYLKTKGAQYQHETVEHQHMVLDTMGIMAEAFLVVVVAAPLFLIILLTVMAIDQGQSIITYGFILSLVFIPLAQLLIGAVIRGMNPRVWT